MQDIEILYNRLKEKYDFTLTNAYALLEDFTWDIPVICGKTSFGEFRLYEEKIIDDDMEENISDEEEVEAENDQENAENSKIESKEKQEGCGFIFYLYYEKKHAL